MDSLIQILLYISIISGGLLSILLLLSLLGGLDLDFDLAGDSDVDTGGLGIVKSGLVFISIGAYVAKILLVASSNPILTVIVSVISGAIAVIILSWFLKLLLRLQSDVNWDFHQAAGKSGKVYLKIPEKGTGIIKVDINGVSREIKARADKEIPTGSEILVLEVKEQIAEVILYNN